MLSLHFIWIKCQQPPICLNYKGQFLQDFPIWKSIIWCDICSLCRFAPIPSLGPHPLAGSFCWGPKPSRAYSEGFYPQRKSVNGAPDVFFKYWGVCFFCVSAFLLFGMDDGMVSYRWGGWLNWYEYVKYLYILVTNMPGIYIQDVTLSCSFMSNIFEEFTHPHFHGNIYIKFDPSKYSKPSCGLVGKNPVTKNGRFPPSFWV